MEYENELKNLMKRGRNKIEKSIFKGLLYCIRFFKKKYCFKAECVEYIRCLMSIVCIHRNKKYNQLFKNILRAELTRAIEVDVDFYDSCFLLYACSRYKSLSKKMYSKIKKRFVRKKLTDRSATLLKRNDFDTLSDEAIDHLYVKLCRKRYKLPKDHFRNYWMALKKVNTNKTSSEMDYHMTHIVYIYNNYSCKYKLKKTKFMHKVLNYLSNRTPIIYRDDDIDLIAETLECMCVLKNRKWLKKYKTKFIRKILSTQHKDGSWTHDTDKSCYNRFHGAWTCINVLVHFI